MYGIFCHYSNFTNTWFLTFNLTKTVYRTETVKNRNTERRSTTSAPEQRKRSTQQQQQEPVRTETMQKQNGGVVDLDDLNRELSREIKKIYKDEREHLG